MKKKNSIYQMWFLPIIVIIVEVIYVWMIIYSFSDFSSFPVYLILLVVILTILSVYSLIYSIIFGFTKIAFNEKSIKKSFLNKWFIREFLWDEIVEVRKVYNIGASNAWICFSRTSIGNMKYNKILKNKNVIIVIDNKKNRETIKRFYFGDINIY